MLSCSLEVPQGLVLCRARVCRKTTDLLTHVGQLEFPRGTLCHWRQLPTKLSDRAQESALYSTIEPRHSKWLLCPPYDTTATLRFGRSVGGRRYISQWPRSHGTQKEGNVFEVEKVKKTAESDVALMSQSTSPNGPTLIEQLSVHVSAIKTPSQHTLKADRFSEEPPRSQRKLRWPSRRKFPKRIALLSRITGPNNPTPVDQTSMDAFLMKKTSWHTLKADRFSKTSLLSRKSPCHSRRKISKQIMSFGKCASAGVGKGNRYSKEPSLFRRQRPLLSRLTVSKRMMRYASRTSPVVDKAVLRWILKCRALNLLLVQNRPSETAAQKAPKFPEESGVSLPPVEGSDSETMDEHIKQRFREARHRERRLEILMWCLCNRLHTVSALLYISLDTPSVQVPSYAFRECLYFLSRYFRSCRDSAPYVTSWYEHQTSPAQVPFETILDLSCRYLVAYSATAGFLPLHSKGLFFLGHYSNPQQLSSLTWGLKEANVTALAPYVKTKFASRLLEFADLEGALSMLAQVPESFWDSDIFQSTCVKLLRTKTPTEGLYNVRSNILARLLEMGVRPNRQMHNVILLNAMEAGDLRTAWSSYRITRDNGMMPNEHTYTVLLKGTQHGDDLRTVKWIHRSAQKEGILPNSRRLAFELLFAYFCIEKRYGWNGIFSELQHVYCSLFDSFALAELGIIASSQTTPYAFSDDTEPGTLYALGVMILAWLRQHRNSDHVEEVYRRYLHHVRTGHPLISRLAASTRVSNAFIKAFGENAKTLSLCTTVMQNMVTEVSEQGSDISADANSEATVDPSPVSIAPPDQRTWNILLLALMINRQRKAAEKVLTMMEVRGMEPNQVTWNSLLTGYGNLQDIEGSVSVVQRMEERGVPADDHTMKALRRVHDRVGLANAIQQATLDLAGSSTGARGEDQILYRDE